MEKERYCIICNYPMGIMSYRKWTVLNCTCDDCKQDLDDEIKHFNDELYDDYY